ncbi:MAG: hypothetical protein RLY21_1777 [Planctomycetota bacterium]|jgi:hypothetical protein
MNTNATNSLARNLIVALCVTATSLGVGTLSGCSASPKPVAPTGAGSYMLTVRDAATGRPVEGVAVTATGAGARQRGPEPTATNTDEDGVVVLRFGNWGAVTLVLQQGDTTERWMVTQDRVAVNGGVSSRDPLRLMVGSRSNGGASAYTLSITRIERGGKIDAD